MATKDFSSSLSAVDDSNWLDLSKSGYAKVIFSDLYHLPNSSVGCKFQITDNVDKHPCDYVGLFKVGYESLNQCIISELLSEIRLIEDGKFLHCSFKNEELPSLENGFYQFLYITKDKEVCGASLPFEIKQPKNIVVVEDIVADNIEDDFLVVRSTLAEQNKDLMFQIEKITETGKSMEKEFSNCIKKMEEDKKKLANELKLAYLEKDRLYSEYMKVLEESSDICKVNDDTLKHLEEQMKAITLNLENKCKAFQVLEKEKNNLEKEKNTVVKERDQLDKSLNTLTNDYKVASTTVELLQRELKLREETLDTDRSSLASQLENAQHMIEALEESKKLAREEATQLADDNQKLMVNRDQLRKQNVYLEGKLKDNYALLDQLRESEKVLIKQVQALELKNEKDHREAKNELKCQILALELKLEDSNKMIEKMRKKKSLDRVAALPSHSKASNDPINKIHQEDTSRSRYIKMIKEKRQHTAKSVLEETKILNTSCAEASPEHKKYQCDELQRELIEKDETIKKLKEECMKKDAVVEFLSKEKDNMQKCNSLMADALKDSVLRLKEAADIYKTQYLEIEKLKKKLNKARCSQKIHSSESTCSKDILNTTAEISDEVLPETITSSQHPSSDSDTGESLIGQCIEELRNFHATASVIIDENLLKSVKATPVHKVESSEEYNKLINEKFKDMFGLNWDMSDLEVPSAPEEQPPCTSKESPLQSLQSFVNKNLAEFSLSNVRGEEQFAIPCPVCNVDIGISRASSEEMIKHLEIQHKQQMCPMCGKLFDMTLPTRYFEYHVEDHFKQQS